MNNAPKTSRLTTVLLWSSSVAILLCGIVAVIYLKIFDTQYAPGYSESAFRSIKIGDTEHRVFVLLGKPFSADSTEPFVEWIYSADPQRHFSASGRGSGTYTTVRFGGTGRVENVSGMRKTSANSFTFGEGQNYLNLTTEQIEGKGPDEIKEKFGPPQAVYEYQASKVLRYSRSPSSSNYHLRTVGVDESGRVVHIWREIYWD